MAVNFFSGPENKKKRKLLYLIVNEITSDELFDENLVDNFRSKVIANKNWKKNMLEPIVATLLFKNRKPRLKPVRITDYVENVAPFYTITEFKTHFRMSRLAVEKLIGMLGAAIEDKKNFIKVSMEKRVLASLWLLGTPDSFRSVSDRFDLSKGNLHYIFIEFIKIIAKERKNFIAWPTEEKMIGTKSFCEEHYGFPGVIGAVDGCHIEIKEPEENKNSYYNRKKTTSILLQGICNEHLIFIDACAGWPGSVHDARMWRSSHIYDCLKGGLRDVCDGHLLGDSAYPLDMFTMTPYKENGHLSADERHYNTCHSSARQMIERSFALLKGRFRRLKYLDMSLVAEISEVIMSACILHNFILIIDGNNDIEDYIGDMNVAPPACDIAEGANYIGNDAAKAKRVTITNRLSHRRRDIL